MKTVSTLPVRVAEVSDLEIADAEHFKKKKKKLVSEKKKRKKHKKRKDNKASAKIMESTIQDSQQQRIYERNRATAEQLSARQVAGTIPAESFACLLMSTVGSEWKNSG